ncbi:hypothetical protein [Pseudomonas sp. S2_F03]
MEIYSNIREVIDGLQGLPWDASLFVNYERWLETPETTPIYLLSELEALEGAQTCMNRRSHSSHGSWV